MNLVALTIETIQLGQPLPFALRASSGALLAQKGYVIRTRAELEVLIARGVQLCIDTDESGDSHRHYLSQLQGMLLSDKPLGHIAEMKIAASNQDGRDDDESGMPDWHGLQLHATHLLRSPNRVILVRAFGG